MMRMCITLYIKIPPLGNFLLKVFTLVLSFKKVVDLQNLCHLFFLGKLARY